MSTLNSPRIAVFFIYLFYYYFFFLITFIRFIYNKRANSNIRALQEMPCNFNKIGIGVKKKKKLAFTENSKTFLTFFFNYFILFKRMFELFKLQLLH